MGSRQEADEHLLPCEESHLLLLSFVAHSHLSFVSSRKCNVPVHACVNVFNACMLCVWSSSSDCGQLEPAGHLVCLTDLRPEICVGYVIRGCLEISIFHLFH